MDKVTIIIPNYNGMQYMAECLQALQQQKTKEGHFHVLVVDNGSADESAALIERDFPAVELIRLSENTGFCHAVNVGIQHAKTPYVLLLNNDTKVYPGFVEALYQAIAQRADCFSVSARMLMWDRSDLVDDAGDFYTVLGWAYGRGKGRKASAYERAGRIFSACGGAAIYRKSVLEQIGLFDERHFAYLEDLDIGYRARIYGYHNYYEPKAKVLHYGSASSGSRYNAWKTGIAAANSVYVIYKNMPFLQGLVNLPFLLIGFLVKFLFFSRKRMGILYIKGLWNGVKKCLCKEGRSKKVRFRVGHLPNYLLIQLELYGNLVQLFGQIIQNFINS